jgi:hypothetical protein
LTWRILVQQSILLGARSWLPSRFQRTWVYASHRISLKSSPLRNCTRKNLYCLIKYWNIQDLPLRFESTSATTAPARRDACPIAQMRRTVRAWQPNWLATLSNAPTVITPSNELARNSQYTPRRSGAVKFRHVVGPRVTSPAASASTSLWGSCRWVSMLDRVKMFNELVAEKILVFGDGRWTLARSFSTTKKCFWMPKAVNESSYRVLSVEPIRSP